MYYRELENAQRNNEITAWVKYFVATILAAQTQANRLIEHTLNKTRFFDQFSSRLNERQLKALRRMLEEGRAGFEGGITANKYTPITGALKAAATRDLQELTEMAAVLSRGGERSTHYFLNFGNEKGFQTH